MKTYYFNTGVRPWNTGTPPTGAKFINNELHLPFVCEDVPENAVFAFACSNPNLDGDYLVVPIVGGQILSKYAYFKSQNFGTK